MLRYLNKYSVVMLILISLFLMGMENGEQGADEQALVERQKQLSAKIELLKQEQDYLLFEKSMYASDSKYLVINIMARTGQLKYKNRVLRDVHFTRLSGSATLPERGAIVLTKKIEGPKERNGLLFGHSLFLQGKSAPPGRLEAGVPRFSLSKRDFLSIYYALETGAKAYIMR